MGERRPRLLPLILTRYRPELDALPSYPEDQGNRLLGDRADGDEIWPAVRADPVRLTA